MGAVGGVPPGQGGNMVGLNTVGASAGSGQVGMIGGAPGGAQVGQPMVMGMPSSQV